MEVVLDRDREFDVSCPDWLVKEFCIPLSMQQDLQASITLAHAVPSRLLSQGLFNSESEQHQQSSFGK